MFGQIVMGPPGSGKTTYCQGMQQLLTAGGRKVAVINLDPANDGYQYECQLDLAELVALESVQDQMGLGPNGGLLYCLGYLAENLDWLDDHVGKLLKEGYTYFLFDCPGQVELFTAHSGLRRVIDHLTREGPHALRLAAVHLVDAHLCTDASKYISALVLSLSTMLHLELPHVNVLSKVDLYSRLLAEQEAGAPFSRGLLSLETLTSCDDLQMVVDLLAGDRFSARFRKLAQGLMEVVDDFGLVNFLPLDIQDRAMAVHVVEAVDQANGYKFGGAVLQGRDDGDIYGAGRGSGEGDDGDHSEYVR